MPQSMVKTDSDGGIAGLLHDFDYEKYPTLEDHPMRGMEILTEKGYPQDIIDAIGGHAEHTGIKRETLMAKTLFAVDELCGFLLACAYVRPDKSIANVQIKKRKEEAKRQIFCQSSKQG